jgi:hypothetical protein
LPPPCRHNTNELTHAGAGELDKNHSHSSRTHDPNSTEPEKNQRHRRAVSLK